MKKIFYVTVILLSFQLNVHAAGKDDTRNAELKYYDAELNKTYKKIIAILNEEGKTNLKEAQRAWIKMRNNDCKWAFVDNRDCLINRTVNRTEELKGTLFMTKDGQYISVK